MSAFDLILKRRNAQDNGHEEILVPVAALADLRVNARKQVVAGGQPGLQATAANITIAGAGTYTAASLLTGLITRDTNGAGRTDTTDTAENILAAFNAVGLLTVDYDEAFCFIKNTADAAETITLAGGTSVTLQAAITIAQNSMTKIAILRTSSTTLVVRQV